MNPKCEAAAKYSDTKLVGELNKKCKGLAGPCERLKVEVTTAPLWHMARAGWGSSESVTVLQKSIDYLTCKAKHKIGFDEGEKEFLENIFEALFWGGLVKWWPDAANLADHYVNGDGSEVSIDADLYRDSVIVSDMMDAMRKYIAEQARAGKQFSPLMSDDPGFFKTPQLKRLFLRRAGDKKNQRDVGGQGYFDEKLKIIVAEQSNQALKNADNRFGLKATSVRNEMDADQMRTVWRVDSYYDFVPFDAPTELTENDKRNITHLPLAGGTIELPDGLSHYMTVIGVAKGFKYSATWVENWRLSSVRK